jgi:hypothetical protein
MIFLFLDFFTKHLFTSRGTTVLHGTQFGKCCLNSTESENFLWIPDTLWNEQAVGQAADINILGSSFKQGCIRGRFQEPEITGKDARLRINGKETKVMIQTKRGRYETNSQSVSKLGCQHLHISAVIWRVIMMGQNTYNAELVRPR